MKLIQTFSLAGALTIKAIPQATHLIIVAAVLYFSAGPHTYAQFATADLGATAMSMFLPSPIEPGGHPTQLDFGFQYSKITTYLKEAQNFNVTVSTIADKNYVFEFTDSLSQQNWTAFPVVAGDGTAKALTDTSATSQHLFYRVRIETQEMNVPQGQTGRLRIPVAGASAPVAESASTRSEGTGRETAV